MSKVIRIMTDAAGLPCDAAGLYLKSFDFEANGGRGDGVFTGNLAEAMRFDSAISALHFWQTQSKTHPLRFTDFKPNRPLTAFTVEIMDGP